MLTSTLSPSYGLCHQAPAVIKHAKLDSRISAVTVMQQRQKAIILRVISARIQKVVTLNGAVFTFSISSVVRWLAPCALSAIGYRVLGPSLHSSPVLPSRLKTEREKWFIAQSQCTCQLNVSFVACTYRLQWGSEHIRRRARPSSYYWKYVNHPRKSHWTHSVVSSKSTLACPILHTLYLSRWIGES